MALLSLIATWLWKENHVGYEGKKGAAAQVARPADSGLGSACWQMSQPDGVQILSMYPQNTESKGEMQSISVLGSCPNTNVWCQAAESQASREGSSSGLCKTAAWFPSPSTSALWNLSTNQHVLMKEFWLR